MKTHVYKYLLLILTLFTAPATIQAQNVAQATLVAKVVDAQNNQTVPFATASILNRNTKAIIKVTQTDADGNLKMPGLSPGTYTFKVSYVGYQTMVRDLITITNQTEINLGTIKMNASKGTALTEVQIKGQKSTMQLGIDKKVFSVDQSLVSEGGSASDLLQNVPTIQTDMDGSVSLRGSSGVRILIDGKPSLIGGGDVAQILQSIPASSIESVEVITNPSSKYDAEGQSGIINIVLKKNKKLGLNGNVALTAGNMDTYNANTSLSFQNNKVNLFGNYSYRTGNRISNGFSNTTYLNNTTETGFANQNTDSKGKNQGHNVKAGIDYNLTEKSVLSLTGGFNFRNNNDNELLNTNKLNSSRNPFELSNRKNSNQRDGNSYDLGLDFSHKFKKPREELTFNASYSKGNNENNQLYNTETYFSLDPLYDPIGITTNIGLGNDHNYNVQADYTLPIGKAGKFEAGYRSQFRNSDNSTIAEILNNTTGLYEMNYRVSNDFNSEEQIHALYANYQNQIGNFGYQLGLRGEDAALNTNSGRYSAGNDISYTPGKVAYTRLYPSVFLTQKFKGDQQVQVNYSRRVNRPRGWDTNPFLDISDPLNYRQGNPNLKPEDVHAYEMAYNKFWPKVTFISTVYFRQTNDAIQRVRSAPDENGIVTTTPENITRERSTGLELIGKIDVVKAWNFTANVNLYQRNIQGVPSQGILENSGFSWNANLTNNITLPYNITLQLKGDYRAPEVVAQGKRNAMYGVDAGAKYDFANKKSSLSLNVRNVLNTRNWSMTTTNAGAPGSTIDFKRYMQGPIASLTYSYRFGNSDFKSKKPRKTEQQESQAPDEGSF